MKNMKKILVFAMAMLLVMAISVAGTVAYLNSTTGEVINTFSVGNVTITLDEANVNEYGVATSGRGTANTYKLIPAHSYTKDPTVHVAEGSEDCFLFVKIVNQIADIEAAGSTTIAAQMAALNWVEVSDEPGVFCLTDGNDKPLVVKAGENKVVFNSFTLAEDADVTANLNDKITIQAYAVQADTLDALSVDDLWAEAPSSWVAQ